MRMLRWWAVVVGGGAVALVFAWLGRLAGVPLETLFAVGGGVAALMWTVVLVTLPWNLHFEARQVLRRNAAGRERGIGIPLDRDREARLIARRTLWLAVGGHLVTAAVSAVFAIATGSVAGWYVAGFFLLTTAIRPAAAFLSHLRERLLMLRREGSFPPDDVAALKGTVVTQGADLYERRCFEQEAVEALRRTAKAFADDLEHLRDRVDVDLSRLENAQAAERAEGRARDERMRERIDQMARRIEATLDGIGDHQELLTGIRALVRMIRTEPA
ncbi:hypothetical protein ACQP2F_29775 [Actinoplanes sp. CA-030573]|uniref:hypothetical protein n=1 Tax=Actinoplanes sp. CA-030573 TaxID=3239898 RepID=UPI003D8F5E6D